MKLNRKNLIPIGLVLLGALIAVGVASHPKKVPEPSPLITPAPARTPSGDAVTPRPCVKGDGYGYEIRRGEPGGDGYWDQTLVRTDLRTCKEEVIVASVDAVVPKLAPRGQILILYAFPEGSTRMYFAQAIADTDAPLGAPFVFDIPTRTFSELSLGGYFGGYGTMIRSPNKKFVASVPVHGAGDKMQNLYLLDLEADTGIAIATLVGNETLNSCGTQCTFGPVANVKWLDDRTIQYEVYSSDKFESLGTRQVRISR